MRARRCAEAGLVLLALTQLAVACAPLRVSPPELVPGARELRFRTALAARETRAKAVEAEMSLWLERDGKRDPGVQATLLLASPSAFRLRVASLFGTAADVGAEAEGLTAWIPPARLGVVANAEDEARVRDLAKVVGRAASGTWRPPAGAFRTATFEDSLLVLSWPEARDTVTLKIGAHGLPHAVRLAIDGAAPVLIDYVGWRFEDEVAWPVRFVAADLAGTTRLTCRVNRVRFTDAIEGGRLRVALPPDAGRLTLDQLMDIVDGGGVAVP